jgi:hypothetical protein
MTSIVLAIGLVVVTGIIAKILRIGSNEFYPKQTERGQLVGRHCCLSGLADFSEDLRKNRDQN